MKSHPTLEIAGIAKAFEGRRVLDRVDLSVAPGTLVAILGASGSGKTTLLRLVAGFERVDAGTIRIGGEIASGRGIHLPPERRRIGYMAQEGALFPHLSVAGNVLFGLPRAERRERRRAEELLALAGLPASYATRAPYELSGGEQSRVALARALAAKPRLVLLDEPFAALDPGLRAETRQAVAGALLAAGAAALLVTHDQPEALSMGHEVAVLRDGRLVQVARPESLYRRPMDAALARFVGEAVLLSGEAIDGTVRCSLGRLALAPDMPDGEVEVLIRPEQIRLVPPGESADAVARVSGVSFYGHDASVSLVLSEVPGAPELSARVAGHMTPRLGEQVGIRVEGAVTVFRAAGSP